MTLFGAHIYPIMRCCYQRLLNPLSPLLLAIFLLGHFSVSSSRSQESQSAENAQSAEPIQKMTSEWIQAKKLISQEAAAWKSEKATLSDLNAIRTKEIEQLNEFVKAAETRVTELSEQRKKSTEEQANVRKWRSEFDAKFTTLEASVKVLLSGFPSPLQEKIADASQRIREPEKDRSLQDRVRDVLLVLQAAREFDSNFTVVTDIREVQGAKREVRVIYMGLSQAWYVDDSGTLSGHGIPTKDGWQWTEDRSIASAVRKVIDIQTGEATAAFVTLPLLPTPSTKQE